MKNMKCYDAVMEKVREADRAFGEEYKLNEASLEMIKEHCEAIDEVMDSNYAEEFAVRIDRDKMTPVVTMISGDFVAEGESNKYYDLIQKVKSFGFYQRDEKVAAYVELPSPWNPR